MADFNELIEVVKQAAIDAVKALKPTSVIFGKVAGADPLQIDVEQKLTLERRQLILSRKVTDHTVEMSVDGVRRQYTVHAGLVAGEEVIMIQLQGGQRFLVLDRLG